MQDPGEAQPIEGPQQYFFAFPVVLTKFAKNLVSIPYQLNTQSNIQLREKCCISRNKLFARPI